MRRFDVADKMALGELIEVDWVGGIADPDVLLLPSWLAVLRVADAYRLLASAFGRAGTVRGFGLKRPLDLPLSGLDPADLSALVAVGFT